MHGVWSSDAVWSYNSDNTSQSFQIPLLSNPWLMDYHNQSLFAELKSYYSDHRAIYTDGSKTENRVAAAATSDGLSAQVRLPGNASIFTAELQTLKMAFNIVKNCDEDRFIIFCDSLSSLQALDGNNCDHPFIQDIFNDCCSVNKKLF